MESKIRILTVIYIYIYIAVFSIADTDIDHRMSNMAVKLVQVPPIQFNFEAINGSQSRDKGFTDTVSNYLVSTALN